MMVVDCAKLIDEQIEKETPFLEDVINTPEAVLEMISKEDDADDVHMKNYIWFLQNYRRIFNTYGKCALIVKGENDYIVYKKYSQALKAIKEDYEPGTVSLHTCLGEEYDYINYIY